LALAVLHGDRKRLAVIAAVRIRAKKRLIKMLVWEGVDRLINGLWVINVLTQSQNVRLEDIYEPF
jgi:hypothetical protein